MAFDGTLKFDTAIDQSGFKIGISNLGSIAKAGMAAVTTAVTAATGAISALGGYSISVGKDFESSMAQVIATMGITKDTIQDGVNSYDLLKESAAAAGESTVFSASEAADALNYLALAGYDAAKAADALPAVLNLAAAGGMDLAYASDLATDAMAALGIEATSENLTRFGDEMAKTASKANTNVSQLGEAILTVGGTAQSLAGGTVELNAALGVLANRGIKGAEGGTHLRNMILSLSAPTDIKCGICRIIFHRFVHNRRFLSAQTKRCLMRYHFPTFYKRHYRSTDFSAIFQFACEISTCRSYRQLCCMFQKHSATM